MTSRSLSLLPIVALLLGGTVVVGMPALRQPRSPISPAPIAAHDEDPAEFPSHVHVARASDGLADRRGTPDTAASRARIEADIALLDARFAAEPLDPDWSLREERALRTFFSETTLRAEGLPSPAGLQTACHSATCRISARFADPVAAEATTERLAAHLAERMPYGAILPRTLDDGSVQVDAWYSAQRILL
ncbi:MAG: hypothetical protein ACOY82_05870 [Pseudomonadota bacterium]